MCPSLAGYCVLRYEECSRVGLLGFTGICHIAEQATATYMTPVYISLKLNGVNIFIAAFLIIFVGLSILMLRCPAARSINIPLY
jgi:hypothetical protein